MSAPVWDDDNQPRFIEDDSDHEPDQHTPSDKANRNRRPREGRRGRDRDANARSGNERPANDPPADTRRDAESKPEPEKTAPISGDEASPAPASNGEEIAASDIFVEMMRRAAATNASREQRRRASEARRLKPTEPDSPSKTPNTPADTGASDSASMPVEPVADAVAPSENDPRPMWQQVRDYTPPTPLERALSSLSKFTAESSSGQPAGPNAPVSGASEDKTHSGAGAAVPDNLAADAEALNGSANGTALETENTEAPTAAPEPSREPPAARRIGRRSLADSLADVVTEHAEAQEVSNALVSSEAGDAESDQANTADQAAPTSEALPTQPLTDEERIAAAKMEAQRVRRVKRRQQQRRQRRVSVLGGIIRSFLVVIPSALLMATILSWWTDPQFLRPEMRHNIQSAIIAEGATPVPPTPFPTPNWARLIGVVSGHSGPGRGVAYDPGAVCDDLESLNEHDINMQTSILVVRKLRERGYVVDLMDEFDPRLVEYEAAALVSIHSNTCQDFGEEVSGFLVAKAEARPEGGADSDLAECIAKYYSRITQLERRFGLTRDMTDYHTFREIDVDTPAAIIELGFMRADREILNNDPELLAEGIVQGIMCFLEPQLDTLPDPTVTPTP